MTLPDPARPGGVEPGDLVDLVHDCHELPESLAARLPVPRTPHPSPGTVGPPVIHTDAVAAVEGWSTYGA